MGASEADIRNVLYSDFQKIPFIKDCSDTTSVDKMAQGIEATLSPNPCVDFTRLNFTNHGSHVRIMVLNALGAQLDIIVDKTLSQNEHMINIPVSNYPSGSYFVRIAIDNAVKTLKFVKI